MAWVCVAAAWCAPAAAPADDPQPIGPEGMLLTGNKGWLWIVHNTPTAQGQKGTFAVAARQAGGNWTMVARDIEAQVAAAAAIDGRLHVVCRRGAYLTFRKGDSGFGAQRSLESGPLALAAATGLGPGGSTVLLAVADARVVPRACRRLQRSLSTRPARVATAPATRPSVQAASKPASAGTPLGLLLLTYHLEAPRARDEQDRRGDAPAAPPPWRPIALLEGAVVAPGGRVMTAVVARRVYLLLANAPAGANRLTAWTNGQWRDVALTGAAAEARALGMNAVGGRLVLVLAEPTEGDKASARLSLAVFPEDQGGTCVYHTIKVEGQTTPQAFSMQSLPVVTGFADQSALLWQDGEALKLATCSPTGTLDTPSEVTVFRDAARTGYAKTIYVYVTCGFALASIALWLSFRRQPAEPFQLPAGVKPAQMPRRILAAVLDLIPFALLAGVLVLPPELPAELQRSQADLPEVFTRAWDYAVQESIPDPVVYLRLLTIVLYTAYAAVMELRFGTTLGKKLLKLRVTGHGGSSPAPYQILLRNLVRAFSLFLGDIMILPLLFLVVPLINRHRQRMGDMIARTTVVDTRFVPAAPPSEGDGQDDRIKTYTEHPPPDDDEQDAEDSSSA